MKKIICFLLMVVIFSSAISVRAEEKYQFLGIGDSITSGYGITNPNDIYVNIINQYLINQLPDKEIITNNAAINGLTSTELLNLIMVNNDLKNKIKDANLIVLSIGGNDYLQELIANLQISSVDSSNFIRIGENLISNLKIIYDNIFDLNTDVIFIVIPLYNPYILMLQNNTELIDIYNQTKDEFVKQVNDYQINYQKKIYTSEKLDDVIESGNNLNPGVDPHPNTNGHKLIASECIKILNKEYQLTGTTNNNGIINKAGISEKENIFFRYKQYFIVLGLIIIAMILEKRYNRVRK